MTDLAIVEEGVRIHIGECCLDTEDDIALEDACALLDDEERSRAAAFVFGRDRDRFIRAHGYLRRQLGAFIQKPPKEIPITANNGEKPVVDGYRVNFNLSHSGSHAVVVMASGLDVGIDLEVVERSHSFKEQLDDLARSCLTGEEQAALAVLPSEQRVRRFLSYWTAKEARMKLTGEGLTLDPRAISLKLFDGLPVGYLRPRAPQADLRFIPLSRPDVICCLAVRPPHSRQGQA